MASSGPLYPSVGESVVSGDANEVTWTTPENIQDADADEATITAPTFDSPDPSYYLVGRGYGFTIPANSTIDGIVVEINRRSIIASSGIDVEVHLRDANGSIIGDNKADTGTVWPSTAATAAYGTSTDTWNTGLSAAALLSMVNDPDFGVFLQAQANIPNADIGVAFIRVTVHYTPPAAENWQQPVNDSIAGTDAARNAPKPSEADSIQSTDQAAWTAQVTQPDAVGGTDAVGKAITLALTDSIQGTDLADPQLSVPSTATYLSVELLQGSTVITDSGTITIPDDTDWHDGVLNIPEADAADITDYSALQLRITGWSDGEDPNVSFAELELPAAAGSKFRRIQNDLGQLGDAAQRAVGRTSADTAVVADGVSKAWTATATEADTAELADSISTVSAYTLTVADEVQGTDQATSERSRLVQIDDLAQATDEAALTAQFTRTQDDSAALTDGLSLAEQNQQGIADSAQLTDVCDPQLTIGTHDWTHPVDDAVQATDAASAAVGPLLPDAAALSDAITQAASKALDDVLAGTDSAETARSAEQAVEDTAALTDSLQVAAGLAVHVDDSALLSDQVDAHASWHLTLEDSIAAADAEEAASTKAQADAAQATDAAQHAWAAERAVDDAAQLDDQLATAEAGNWTKGLADVAGISDATAETAAFVRAQDDAASGTDATAKSAAAGVEDAADAADLASPTWQAERAVDDAVQVLDGTAAVESNAFQLQLSDGMQATDEATTATAYGRAFVDVATTADAVGKAVIRDLEDAASASDEPGRQWAAALLIVDAGVLADGTQIGIAGRHELTLSDGISTSDAAAQAAEYARLLADDMVAEDETGRAQYLRLADLLAISDQLARTYDVHRTLADLARLRDHIRPQEEEPGHREPIPPLEVLALTPNATVELHPPDATVTPVAPLTTVTR